MVPTKLPYIFYKCTIVFLLPRLGTWLDIYEIQISYFNLLQASGPSLPQRVLDPLPAPTFPLLPLMATKQCCLEEGNLMAESATATLSILCQW